ncbi:MAG: DNA-3-methyladenine glycosylase [Clostridia bacterium]|jgi:DNA-3-methyladenine glycosylase|nr:DNA-3-methyladenine glycosylase [Clostridia bacterium]
MKVLDRDFYKRDTITVSKELLGKVLVHQTKNYTVAGRIVETEAYLGPEDKAAHSYGGKMTPRVEVMYNQGGYSYIFTIYGMYQCFNIVTEKQGTPQAALIRALEPVENLDFMAMRRFNKVYTDLSKKQIKDLTNGPGKLCIAMDLGKEQNKIDLCSSNGVDDIYVYDDGYQDFEIEASPRINIDYAEEYVDMPWRFTMKGNMYLSKK